jgi:glc operon protein GlcG
MQTEIDKLIGNLGRLIPEYAKNPLDAFADGNVAVCIIDESGNLYGKIWGDNKVRGRRFARLAWVKATQVWITGMKTGEYEKRLFNEEFDEKQFGIEKPDLIGWEGGQPIILKSGAKLSVGFSGFRGIYDLEIVVKAVAAME